tara:strand:+ start:1340 stop:1537 length:198 start_codon:yes stop_codon:yes gene_type:complete
MDKIEPTFSLNELEYSSINQTITVDLEYFKLIERDSHLLEYLDAHGVDGWSGYDDAVAEYERDQT